jgi:CheY-like chemotaxis protein
MPRLTAGPFSYRRYADRYLDQALRYAKVALKQAVISPSALSLLYPDEGIPGYPRDVFIEDLLHEHVIEVRRCLENGAEKVQIDFTEGRLALKFIVALPISVIRTEDTGRHERPSFADVDLFSVALPSLAGTTVLVVDDEPDARLLVSRIVEERGARAIVGPSADEALRLLGSESVNIIVSDIGMPDFDGYQLIQKIRGLGNTVMRNIPAIALTAYARADDRQRALLAGYQMHLSKPVEPRELIAGVASLLNIPHRV